MRAQDVTNARSTRAIWQAFAPQSAVLTDHEDGEPSRDELHRLIDQLPEERLEDARKALERVRARNGDQTAEDRRDVELINAHADELNAEAEDVLGYRAHNPGSGRTC